jgi:isochorismate hydrolase
MKQRSGTKRSALLGAIAGETLARDDAQRSVCDVGNSRTILNLRFAWQYDAFDDSNIDQRTQHPRATHFVSGNTGK